MCFIYTYQFYLIIYLGSKNVIQSIAESFAHVGNAMCVKFSPKVNSTFPGFFCPF